MDKQKLAKIFSSVRTDIYSIEWQKRDLPHAHILVQLEINIKDDQINYIIRAELPNQENDPEESVIAKTHIVHGPCGVFNPQSPGMRH